MPTKYRTLYGFGPFRLAPAERHLWRDDACVHLTPKAFDLLVLLVEHAGHLCDRQWLIDRLWADTVVEEHSLTWNISTLRKTLGDLGDDPQYIETVRGHGYRFIAAVEPLGEASANATEQSPSPVSPAADDAPAAHHLDRPPLRRALLVASMLAVAVLLVLVGRFSSRLGMRNRAATEVQRPVVAVLGFRNLSGEHDLDWVGPALTEMIGTELATGGMANALPAAEVARARHQLQIGVGGLPDSDQLKQLRRALGADTIITGAYLRTGTGSSMRTRVDIRMLAGSHSRRLSATTTSASGDDMFVLVDDLGRKLRRQLGLQALNPAQLSAFEASMPTHSEAAAAYANGLMALAAGDSLAARRMLQHAVQLEPDFPLSHSALARAWLDLGDDSRAADQARLALRHSAGLALGERLLISGLQAEASHHWKQATDAYQQLFEQTPDSLHIGLLLARAQTKARDFDAAKRTITALRRLPAPFGDDPRVTLAAAAVHGKLGEHRAYYDDAMTAARRALTLGSTSMRARALSVAADACNERDDFTHALELAHKAQALFATDGNRDIEAGINLERMGNAYQGLGRYDRAVKAFGDANEIFAHFGNHYWQAASLNNTAGVEFRRDRLAEARRAYERALLLFRDVHRDRAAAIVLGNLASVMAAQGDLDAAIVREKQSLALRRSRGADDDNGIASTLLNLGLDSAALGRIDNARQYLQQARDMYLHLDAGGDASDAISGLADLDYQLDRLDAARHGYERALKLRRAHHLDTAVAWSERDLAELNLDTDHVQRGLQLARKALPAFVSANARGDIVSTQAVIALALVRLDQRQAAAREAKRVDTAAPTVRDVRTRLGVDIARASVDWRLGHRKQAATLLHAALTQAQALKLKSRSYPARLQLAQMRASQPLDDDARRQIQQLVSDARHDRFLFVASRARALLNGTNTIPRVASTNHGQR